MVLVINGENKFVKFVVFGGLLFDVFVMFGFYW